MPDLLPDNDLPSDATELARIIQDPSSPKGRKELAWELLSKRIRQLARLVAKGNSQIVRDLIEDSVSHVLERVLPRFDPNRRAADGESSGFESFCKAALHNLLVDRSRKDTRQRKLKLKVREQLKHEEKPHAQMNASRQEQWCSQVVGYLMWRPVRNLMEC